MKADIFPGVRQPCVRIFLSVFLFIVFLFPVDSFCQRFSYNGTVSSSTDESPGFLRMNEINPAAFRHFREHFPNCNNEKWVRDQKLYTAVFKSPSSITRVYYKLNGNFESEIKSYGPELLDNELKSRVYKEFEGYRIKTITEVNDGENAVYFIKILSSSNIKTLKCAGNEITITEDYINGGI